MMGGQSRFYLPTKRTLSLPSQVSTAWPPIAHHGITGPPWERTGLVVEMAPRVCVNFISLVTSCVGLLEEEPQTNLPHVLYIAVSYSHQRANRTLNSTQSIVTVVLPSSYLTAFQYPINWITQEQVWITIVVPFTQLIICQTSNIFYFSADQVYAITMKKMMPDSILWPCC